MLAGTDSNQTPVVPLKHGESLHRELELPVDAGLSTEEALRPCTSLSARCFRLGDRGTIVRGKRADLVLVGGNPIDDIASTKNVRKVWVAGREVGLE